MLKIKADRMKDLEKFGFKKFYNCDTGELLRYYFYFDEKHQIYFIVANNACNEQYILNPLRFDISSYSSEYQQELINKLMELIYNLVKADMVEKVVEDE